MRLDGADIYNWERSDFGQHIGYIPQDVELFTGTVAENIARMALPDDEAIINAAQLAGVHEIILRLAKGYETVINSSAFKLSGGQRQRIALARALYKNPQLIVLDEPDSNLDNEGEQALKKAIAALKQRKATTILIAHRSSLVQHVDRIIILNEGQIQSEGPRDQIISRLKKIAQLQSEQSRHKSEEGDEKA